MVSPIVMRVNDSQFVYKIPDELSSAEVAPLLCGGQTVWTPLNEQTKSTDRRYPSSRRSRPHGYQFAGRSARRHRHFVVGVQRDAALSHGANKFLVHTDDDEMAAAAGTLDFILVTIATNKEVGFAKFFLSFVLEAPSVSSACVHQSPPTSSLSVSP